MLQASQNSKPKVLLVDDEASVLDGLRRKLARRFRVTCANSGPEGLAALETESFAVISSDMRMPEMTGAEFLAQSRLQAPDSTRILLTGFSDMEATRKSVNEGGIFRFLSKPCESEELLESFDAAAEHHRLKRAEKELLEETLVGAVGVLSEVVALVNPTAFGCASRIRRTVRAIWERFEPDSAWQADLASQLCQIGLVNGRGTILGKIYSNEPLCPEEQEVFDGQGELARRLIARIPRLSHVAECIAQQYQRGQSSDMPLGARILQAVLEHDRLVVLGAAPRVALDQLKADESGFDPAVLAALEEEIVSESSRSVRLVSLPDLKPGMALDAPILSERGVFLLGVGQELTATIIDRVAAFESTHGIRQPIAVRLHTN